ncbi:MAG: glycosyltransferase family 2 protein [Bacteroidaceae bacterium]|nr:glycosyltransferase family 2 protein [Bacteroidaceae bacterium]
MKVSVLVPIYNVEPFIGKCLESIIHQTYSNFELVCCNDASTDGSRKKLIEIFSSYPDLDYKLIDHPVNQGIAQTRNDLLNAATGDYILFVDSDDWIELNMIEIMLNKSILSNADLVGCYHYNSRINGSESVKKVLYSESKDESLRRVITYRICSELWKLLIKRSIIEDNNMRFSSGVNIGEDYLFSIQLYYYASRFAFVTDPLYHYVQYNPIRYSKPSLKGIEDHIEAIKMAESFFLKNRIYDSYKEELMFRKFRIRSNFVLNKLFRDTKRWRRLFPETNYLCWKSPIRDRIKYFLAYLRLL